MTPQPDTLTQVENACSSLHTEGQPVTFTAIAAATGISRTTLYRNPALKAVIQDHRVHNPHDPRTITGLVKEITHLRTAVHTLASQIKTQEQRIRQLEQESPNRHKPHPD